MTPRSKEEGTPEKSPSPTKEALPPHTSEIGSLKKQSKSGTDWLGSSSGVYFVNTVRRTFTAAYSARNEAQSFRESEDILVGGDSGVDGEGANGTLIAEGYATWNNIEHTLAAALGSPPDRALATELVGTFFKAWHPVFPFLHGPTFLADLETIYPRNTSEKPVIDIRKSVLFQLVINVASLDRPDIPLPVESRIKTSADIMRISGILARRHDIETIQALLAAELYLVAIISLREASTVGGMLLRAMFHAGLHRCPLRYADLSQAECEIRRRIFWSAYALDRHMSQSLGYPLTLQDSDIDTCLSGDHELQKPHAREILKRRAQGNNQPGSIVSSPASEASGGKNQDKEARAPDPEAEEKQRREAVLMWYVQYSRLTGRAIEIFHKSIHARFAKREAIVYLTSDIEQWWNDLPGYLSGEDVAGVPAYHQLLAPFFTILYQNLRILMNRPSLSLDPGSPDFQHGLQICIHSSRTILLSLRQHHSSGQSMFLPGLLPANWMAGLIIAFACQLGKYPVTRACSDINNCLDLLKAMGMNTRWHTATECHYVLSSFLADIKRKGSTVNTDLLSKRESVPAQDEEGDRISNTPSPKRQRISVPKPPAPRNSQDEKPRPSGSIDQQITGGPPQRPPSQTSGKAHNHRSNSFGAVNDVNAQYPTNLMPTNWFGAQPAPSWPTQTPTFASAYPTDPQGLQYTSEFPTTFDATFEGDPSFWNNFNYNMDDVFESAILENMPGQYNPPMASGWDP